MLALLQASYSLAAAALLIGVATGWWMSARPARPGHPAPPAPHDKEDPAS
jgi:hypothetical protein